MLYIASKCGHLADCCLRQATAFQYGMTSDNKVEGLHFVFFYSYQTLDRLVGFQSLQDTNSLLYVW